MRVIFCVYWIPFQNHFIFAIAINVADASITGSVAIATSRAVKIDHPVGISPGGFGRIRTQLNAVDDRANRIGCTGAAAAIIEVGAVGNR